MCWDCDSSRLQSWLWTTCVLLCHYALRTNVVTYAAAVFDRNPCFQYPSPCHSIIRLGRCDSVTNKVLIGAVGANVLKFEFLCRCRILTLKHLQTCLAVEGTF